MIFTEKRVVIYGTLAVFSVFCFWLSNHFDKRASVTEIDSAIYLASIDEELRYEKIELVGESMFPEIPDKTVVTIDRRATPKTGDAISFDCQVEKCKNGEYPGSIKFIDDIDSNGCYYLQGRKDHWLEKGVLFDSFDSNDYGYLCPGEFTFNGVVLDSETKKPIRRQAVKAESKKPTYTQPSEPEIRTEKIKDVYPSQVVIETRSEYPEYVPTPPPSSTISNIPKVKRLDTPEFNPKMKPFNTSNGKPLNGSECSSSSAPNLPQCNF